jgi:type II secretory pathway pseudopilin PulG
MRSASPRRTKAPSGLTTLELTVVVSVLLTLAAIMMFGAQAWRRGVDRTSCLLTIRNVQTSVRAYQNLYGYAPGTMPAADRGTQSIIEHLMLKGYISEDTHHAVAVAHACPGSGHYRIPQEDVFPLDGELYLSCSLEDTEEHRLTRRGSW